MTDDKKVGALNSIDPTLTSLPTKAEKNEQVDKNEFIHLLVTQLKNQDPLDPMDNDEFAVKLAQFSQLEQLVSINEKMGAESGDLSSMAAYLGQEVTLNTNALEVENGDGGMISFNLEKDAASLEVEFLDEQDRVVDTVDLGAQSAGKQSVALSDLQIANGEYAVRLKALDAQGGAFEPDVKVAGIVSGFIPGAEPVLIVGNREVTPSEVVEVKMPKA